MKTRPIQRFLACDVGGTNARFATVERNHGKLSVHSVKILEASKHESFDAALSSYLADQEGQSFEGLAVGIAGPILGDEVAVTNLPWVISGRTIREQFGFKKVTLLNDLEAHAYGILLEEKNQASIETLRIGTCQKGNKVLIAPGTGLGQAFLRLNPDTGNYSPAATEGGHCDFAPMTIEDSDLFNYLHRIYGHVSWERVISGSFGFANLLRFYRDVIQLPISDELQNSLDSPSGPGASIVAAANAGTPIACRVMDTYCRLLGAEAGNLALKGFAVGGIYLGGGIPPKILSWLRRPPFLQGLDHKGRMKELVEQFPVHVLMDPENGIKGAALALEMMAGNC